MAITKYLGHCQDTGWLFRKTLSWIHERVLNTLLKGVLSLKLKLLYLLENSRFFCENFGLYAKRQESNQKLCDITKLTLETSGFVH